MKRGDRRNGEEGVRKDEKETDKEEEERSYRTYKEEEGQKVQMYRHV